MNKLSTTQRSVVRYLSLGLLGVVMLMFVVISQISFTIKVTEAEAQAVLDAQLVKLNAKDPAYEIDRATIDFSDNQMTIEAGGGYNKQIGKLPELQVTAALSSTGAPDYRGGSIYFLPSAFSLDSFLLNGEEPADLLQRLVTETATEIVPQLRDKALAHPKVSKWLDKLGGIVDTVQNDTSLSEGADVVNALVEQYREPAKALLEQKVRDILETTPLYTLGKNWKELLARAALADIKIENGTLMVTFSGMSFLATLFLGILFVLALGGVVVGFAAASRPQY